MGLFKSKEEKQDEKDHKVQELLEKYGLGDLTDPETRALSEKLVTSLAGTGLMEAGSFLAPNQATFMRLQNIYISALMEQNFIIIRQLDQISKALER